MLFLLCNSGSTNTFIVIKRSRNLGNDEFVRTHACAPLPQSSRYWCFYALNRDFLFFLYHSCNLKTAFCPISLHFYSCLLLLFCRLLSTPVSLPPHIDCGSDPQCPLHPLLPWVSHGGRQTETEGWKPRYIQHAGRHGLTQGSSDTRSR